MERGLVYIQRNGSTCIQVDLLLGVSGPLKSQGETRIGPLMKSYPGLELDQGDPLKDRLVIHLTV